MANITLKGSPIHTAGDLPAKGSIIPDFSLTKADLSDVSLADFGKNWKILNIVPSLDTGVCSASAKRFEKETATFPKVQILTISYDTPFAMKRFCQVENINNVTTLSSVRSRKFGQDYKVEMVDGPMRGLFSRAIILVDGDNKVVYTEQVPEIAQEPDYTKLLEVLKQVV